MAAIWLDLQWLGCLVLECHSKSEPFTEQLSIIQNPNVFGIQDLTVFLRQSVLS